MSRRPGKSVWIRLSLLIGLLLSTYGNVACADQTESRKAVNPDSAQRPSKRDKEIAKLIEQLGNDDFVLRDRAEKRLIRIGPSAFDAISAAQQHADAEIALRARSLLRKIRVRWWREYDSSQVRRILKSYESQNHPARLRTIVLLASLPPAQATEGLCRIIRYEQNRVLAKRAAIAIIDRPPPLPDQRKKQKHTILTALGPSQRPPAEWLRAYLEYDSDPKKSLARMETLALTEYQELKRTREHSDRTIVLALWQHLTTRMREQNRQADASKIMLRMIDLQSPNADSLFDFVKLLIRHQAWSVVDEVARRFQRSFDRSPPLLYAQAEAHWVRGRREAAEESAARASKMNAENGQEHLFLAYRLQEIGLPKWAEREYETTWKVGPTSSQPAIVSRRWLSNLLHDQGRDEQAALALTQLVEVIQQDKKTQNLGRRLFGENWLRTITSQIDFYWANHYQQQGDAAKQVERLSQAVAKNPRDPDILIAMFRLSKQTEADRKQTAIRIEQAAEKHEADLLEAEQSYRQKKISEEQESRLRASAMNGYAWLISNTQGDFDKALRYSQDAVALRPESGALYDTLAQCYVAKKNYSLALAYQQRAALLEPHSLAIARSLKRIELLATRKDDQ